MLKFLPLSETLFNKPPNSLNQQILITQLLNALKNKPNLDEVEMELLRALQRLALKDRLRIKIYDDDYETNAGRTYGYFSPFQNCIYLMAAKTDFQTKWLGLATNYDLINDNSFEHFTLTILHELIHYVCSNSYESYCKLWKDTIKNFLWIVFNNICDSYFFDFVSKDVYNNISSKDFINSNNFKKAFDTYYNSLSINMKFRSSSFTKRYNDLLSTLYSKHNFAYARFFDNVLINVHKLATGDFTKTSVGVYNCIKDAYPMLVPDLQNVKINNLFYQELYEFSEISCVLATYYKYAPKYKQLIIETLDLV